MLGLSNGWEMRTGLPRDVSDRGGEAPGKKAESVLGRLEFLAGPANAQLAHPCI